MSAMLLDGRALARELRAELRDEVRVLREAADVLPRLAVVQVGSEPASERYAASIRRLCDHVEVECLQVQLAEGTPQSELERAIQHLSADPSVHGILIEMPLPQGFSVHQVVRHLDYRKDVDGVHPLSVGLLAQGQHALVPNTPAGGMELLKRYGIDVARKRAAVVGYSDVVGRPMAELLLYAKATVTVCHIHTPDLAAVLRDCEIVVVAVGRAGLVTGAMLRPGAVVVDFGINVQPEGGIVGDVDFGSAVEVASAITPVPGGTGPVTNIMLLRNLLTAVRRQHAD